jgi:hypothetical protein
VKSARTLLEQIIGMWRATGRDVDPHEPLSKTIADAAAELQKPGGAPEYRTFYNTDAWNDRLQLESEFQAKLRAYCDKYQINYSDVEFMPFHGHFGFKVKT